MADEISDTLARPSLEVDEHGFLRHRKYRIIPRVHDILTLHQASNNCVNINPHPERILDHINFLLPSVDLRALKARTRAAIAEGRIARRLTIPIETLLDHVDKLKANGKLSPKDVDKNYLELCRWLLLSYGEKDVWDMVFQTTYLNGNFLSIGLVRQRSAEDLRKIHDILQAHIQMLNAMEMSEKHGGPFMPGEVVPRIPSAHEGPSFNFTIFNHQLPSHGTASELRQILETCLCNIHLGIDEHNATVFEKLHQVMKRFHNIGKIAGQNKPETTPELNLVDAIMKLVPAFNKTERLLQELINTIDSQATSLPQTNQEDPSINVKNVSNPIIEFLSPRPPHMIVKIAGIELNFGELLEDTEAQAYDFLEDSEAYRRRANGEASSSDSWGSTSISINEAFPSSTSRPHPTVEDEYLEPEEGSEYTEADDYRALQEFKIKSRARADVAKAKIAKARQELAAAERDVTGATRPSSPRYKIEEFDVYAYLVPTSDGLSSEEHVLAGESSVADRSEDNEELVYVKATLSEEFAFADNEQSESGSEPKTGFLIDNKRGEISANSSAVTLIPRAANGSPSQDSQSPSSIVCDPTEDLLKDEETNSGYSRGRSPTTHATTNTEEVEL